MKDWFATVMARSACQLQYRCLLWVQLVSPYSAFLFLFKYRQPFCISTDVKLDQVWIKLSLFTIQNVHHMEIYIMINPKVNLIFFYKVGQSLHHLTNKNLYALYLARREYEIIYGHC
jgi:hypothetical protein